MKTNFLLLLILVLAPACELQTSYSDLDDYTNADVYTENDEYSYHYGGSDSHDHYYQVGPRVIVYEDANFSGQSLTIYPGELLDNLKRESFDQGISVNDQISSVRVLDGATVMLYDHPHMKGQVLRVTEDIRNLDHRMMPDLQIPWNDRISSLRVGGRDSYSPRNSRPPQAVKNPDLMIKKAYQDVLDRPADPNGLRYYRGLVIDQGWSARMVRKHLRDSDEFRGESVDLIIRRAYKDVLKREPDPSGMANYRRLMINERWSEQKVRDNLRNSPEYRNR